MCTVLANQVAYNRAQSTAINREYLARHASHSDQKNLIN